MPDSDNYLFKFTTSSDLTRDLLENYVFVGNQLFTALVPAGDHYRQFHENVDAAIMATSYGLSSLDYAKRRYGMAPEDDPKVGTAAEAYTSCYFLAKHYVADAIKRVKTEDRPLPEAGVFGASLVLERLPTSFLSAHLLYRLGHGYEGHAVARLILEQLAWAYAAYAAKDFEKVKVLSATRAVTKLKSLHPEVGRLYGFLSDKTHLSYSNHFEFLRVEDGKNVIYHAQGRIEEYAQVLLLLADLFVIVWEITQADYLDEYVAIKRLKSRFEPKKTREFKRKMRQFLKLVAQA